MTLRILYALLSACLGTVVAICVFLPWYEIPVLGQTVPSPPWNKAGVACIVLAAVLYLRAIGGWPIRWLVRVSLLPTFYFWWISIDSVKAWGSTNLGAAQLKLSTVNLALTKLGGSAITLYEPALWNGLEPTWGWKATGAALALTVVFTLVDGPRRLKCSECGAKGGDGDRFCHSCGVGLGRPRTTCKNCGTDPRKGDVFCRRCSQKLE